MLRGIVLATLVAATVLIVALAPVSYAGSDPRGALLTSQAILEHGTFALDAYPDFPASYRTVERRGHRFYSYPPGTPVLAVPAVAVARLVGFDLTRDEDDARVQRALAAASVGLTMWLAALLAMRWFRWPLATALATSFVLATPIVSTMGSALWSINATVVAILAGLVILAREDDPVGPAGGAAAGALLGVAVWCRPSAVLLGAVITAWLVARAWRADESLRPRALAGAATLAGAFGAGILLLVVLSRVAYGTWLPDYYAGAPSGSMNRFATALRGHLVSPSRGALVYAPAILIMLGALCAWPRRVLAFPLAVPALAWMGLHVALLSRFPVWWGGYGFGPRLLVDAFPGVLVLLCAAAAAPGPGFARTAGAVALVLASLAGAWINIGQGLFNRATESWNVSPDINTFPGYAFDWGVPQFRSTQAALATRLARHRAWSASPLRPGVDYHVATPSPGIIETAGVGGGPELGFTLSEQTLGGSRHVRLTMALDVTEPARGALCLNGAVLARVAPSSRGTSHYVLTVPIRRFRTIEYDILQWNAVGWCEADVSTHAPRPVALRVAPARVP